MTSGFPIFTPLVPIFDRTGLLLEHLYYNGNANDTTGNGYNGVPGVGVTFVENGANLDGTVDVATIDIGTNIPIGLSDYSVDLWFYPTILQGTAIYGGISSNNSIVTQIDNNAESLGNLWVVSNTGATAGYWGAVIQQYTGGINNWHHIVFAADRDNINNLKFFLNNVMAGSDFSYGYFPDHWDTSPRDQEAGTSYSWDLRIGGHKWYTAFTGIIGEFRVWTKYLTQTNVANIYGNTKVRYLGM